MHRLKDRREDRDLKQKEIADIVGCSQATYSRYETGSIGVPVDVLIKLSTYYKTSVDYILGITEKNNYEMKKK